MKPSDTGKSYNQITHLWDNKRFNMDNGIAQHKQAIQFVKKRRKALDIGCGSTGRIIELLIKEGFTPSGLDVSSEMIALAQQQHPNIQLLQADICEYELPEKYDFISAWDSVWHVPLSEQKRVITKIIDGLTIGGILVFSFGGTDTEGSHVNEFMGPEVYYASLGTNNYIKLFISLGCVIRHLEYDQHPELHAYIVVEKT